MHINQKFCIQ